MENLKNFFNYVFQIINKDIIGISLIEFLFIFFAFIVALLIRGIIAKILVNKIKYFISKTANNIDNLIFDALIPPFKLVAFILVFFLISLYLDNNSRLGIFLTKINKLLEDLYETYMFENEHYYLVFKGGNVMNLYYGNLKTQIVI